jgi:hypothetical protein
VFVLIFFFDQQPLQEIIIIYLALTGMQVHLR